VEARAHLTTGLELLTTLPSTSERHQQELALHLALGSALMVSKGFGTPEVERTYTRARELAQQVGDTRRLFQALRGLRQYYLVHGKLQAAHELAEQLLRVAECEQDAILLTTAHKGYGGVGQVDTGLRLLAEILAVVETSGERVWEAELYRLKGTLLLRQGTPDEHQAETCFQTALGIARRQQAKSLELRAALSLSRLWQQQGKRVEAYDLLGPIYHWFTEGFDTADLQEAKTFLEELGV
jgi:predicted ATPase